MNSTCGNWILEYQQIVFWINLSIQSVFDLFLCIAWRHYCFEPLYYIKYYQYLGQCFAIYCFFKKIITCAKQISSFYSEQLYLFKYALINSRILYALASFTSRFWLCAHVYRAFQMLRSSTLFSGFLSCSYLHERPKCLEIQ